MDENAIIIKPRQRTLDQRLSDRAKIAELLEDGYSQAEIAKQLEMSPQQVNKDIIAIRAMWEQRIMTAFGNRQEFIFQKIQTVEREAWEAWEKSKEPKTVQSMTKGETVNKQMVKKEERGGDPRYLAIAADCIDRYAKLLGTNVERVELSGPDGGAMPIQIVEVVRPE